MHPTIAEIRLVQLKNCFANIPTSLVHVLGNANAIVQDVALELQYKDDTSTTRIQNGPNESTVSQRSVYVGWTGMASSSVSAPVSGRIAKRGGENVGMVEIDAVFGRMLGLSDGQKVNLLLHLNPPLAYTVHIEPLTPADWEIIELHASFLESNLLFQVRALPNPSFGASPTNRLESVHPLTIHLSPTSTANIVITSLTPPQPSSVPFAKIAPDGEVIVAPKTRSNSAQDKRTKSRSITSRKSLGARSAISTRQSQGERTDPKAVFLRPIDQSICEDYFSDEDETSVISHCTFSIWADQKVVCDRALKGSEWVCVSVINPGSIQSLLDARGQQRFKDAEASEAGLPASTVVARLLRWQDAPDTSHAALSTMLCSSLGVVGIGGGIVRLSVAPPPLLRSEIDGFQLFPFVSDMQNFGGLHLNGHANAGKQINPEQRRVIAGNSVDDSFGLLNGPVVDGQLCPPNRDAHWEGGILRLRARPSSSRERKLQWCLGITSKDSFTLQQSTLNPLNNTVPMSHGYEWPEQPPRMVGVDKLLKQVQTYIMHSSSVLLTGGLGSGKTSLTKLLAHQLRCEELFSTIYLPCAKLVVEEARSSTVKEMLSRLLLTATWDTKLAGRSLIILDDLDKLCPVETELQTAENSRSRQLSEFLCSLLQDHYGRASKSVILATAQSKESLHGLIIGSNIVKEIVALKAPDKDGRRKVLEGLAGLQELENLLRNGLDDRLGDESIVEEVAWMEDPTHPARAKKCSKVMADDDLDFVDLAGQTDGFMPGDLVLLVSRAKSEALIRTVEDYVSSEDGIVLTAPDFQKALQGFTPASLRNVTLQTSKTTFDSIGGLHEIRKILLETLQYPTTYAPIFAQCPLRLRSGLLLYGYPGCGKTLLASAVAGECGLNFISVKGPEILNKYIGASEKSVRDLFERAESARPCVLFFDEFDSIAPKRGHDSTGVTDRVVNQLLTQMDGAEGLSGVYVLAATSRPDLIDPALLRPGRLDKSLLCDMPNADDRLDILRALAKKLTFAPAVLSEKSSPRNLAEIARRTVGYSGADLQAVIYNAHLEAIHDVLGGHNINSDVNGKKSREIKKGRHNIKPDILQFRFGNDDNVDNMPSSVSRAREASEYASIIAKLDAIRFANKKEKQQRRNMVSRQEKTDAHEKTKEKSGQKVVIEWKHIEISLSTTRHSIGPDERKRLERIYRDFVAGRTGVFPDGQGSTEVGGRSSLM